MLDAFPSDPADLTCEHLTHLIGTVRHGIEVTDFSVYESKSFGGNDVSTACRIGVDVSLSGVGSKDVPLRWLIKTSRPELGDIPLYRNEVDFYTRMRPEIGIETPACFGAQYYASSGTFGIAMEDLRLRNAEFSTVMSNVSQEYLRGLLRTLAKLHGTYWDTPRFEGDLAWLQPHTSGDIYTLFNHPDMLPSIIASEIDDNQFKKELIDSVEQDADGLYREFRKLQQHQSRLPQTVCHGDSHIGNAYLLDNGVAGLLDWQLMAKGFCMHDIAYLLITGMSVADRRKYEKKLLRYYADQLKENGVNTVPDEQEFWLEYRRAVVWGLYIGWLTTPLENYGWEITVNNHIRLITAYRDLNCGAALADLPDAASYVAI